MRTLIALLAFFTTTLASAATGEWIYAEAKLKLTKVNDQFGTCYDGTSNDIDGDLTFKIDPVGDAPAPAIFNLSASGSDAKITMAAVKPTSAEPNLLLKVKIEVRGKLISETELGMWHKWPNIADRRDEDPNRLPDFQHKAFFADDACPDRVDIVMTRVYSVPMDR